MNPSNDRKRRPRKPGVGVESLETRELLTGGAGNTFAIIPGTIAKPGGTVSVPFTIDPAHFTLPHGKMVLGIDVATATGTTVKPVIVAIVGPNGRPLGVSHSRYDPSLPRTKAARGLATSAALTTVGFDAGKSATYHVILKAQGKSSGSLLVGFFLPGNVSGNGTVSPSDLTTTTTALGATATTTNTKYNFEADANRDGRINRADVRIVQQNMGVATTISPVVSANLDPASTIGVGTRTTNLATVHFTGATTPGATITYNETSHKLTPVSATADGKGNYSINVPVGAGGNTFHVKTLDAFGQSIQGDLAAVTSLNTAPTPTAKTTTTQANSPSTPATTGTLTPSQPTTSTPTTSSTTQGSTTPSSATASATPNTTTTTVTTPTSSTTTTTPNTATTPTTPTTSTTTSSTTTTTPNTATTPTTTTTPTKPTTTATTTSSTGTPSFDWITGKTIWAAALNGSQTTTTTPASSGATSAGTTKTT